MILVVNCGSSKTPHIAFMLHQLGFNNRTVPIDDFSVEDLEDVDGLILSGSPILLTETDPSPYLKRFGFLKDINIPVLGICFGHQILGMIHGAEISRCPEDRQVQTIRLVSTSRLFEQLGARLQFEEDHCECISLPEAFHLVASSSICEVEAMQHKSTLFYGVQFHPEVSGESGKQLLSNFATISENAR